MSLLDKIFGKDRKLEVKTPVSAVAEAVEQLAETVEGFNPKANATKRHGADMMSDSELSKNIRPIVLLWLLAIFSVQVIADMLGATIDEQLKELTFWALIAVLGFYFPGRSIEKIISNRKPK